MGELGWGLVYVTPEPKCFFLAHVALRKYLRRFNAVSSLKMCLSPGENSLKECGVSVWVIYFGFYTGIIAIHISVFCLLN